ncbi:protein phosphatase 1 regulatory inhibitor subunit 11 [Rhinolophus ferrumequinum]|uniref:E3 ubiquitin-protein ligase PPP1R11 n=1 Tax=Rhinolophus ferrumequinum TaxID=59479 RepID=A0A7J7YST5_RHIFE|nr:protein phosphatase 1 regulatory inhibitor subunit 11 [Rhinolophus ferrumequinum]
MAEAGAGLSETVTETTVTVTTEPENRSLTIKLRKRKPEKKVEWTSDTVDNEHMGRRSSKCCCIYEKPRAFGESSTESDEEEEEGCGHTHCVRGLLTPPSPLQGQCSTKFLSPHHSCVCLALNVFMWLLGDSTHGLIPFPRPPPPLWLIEGRRRGGWTEILEF